MRPVSIIFLTPLALRAGAQSSDSSNSNSREGISSGSSPLISTVTSFTTVGGTITSFYDCFNPLPFCSAVIFGPNGVSPTSSGTSSSTAIPTSGQPVTLSVTGSDGIPLAAQLSSNGQLVLVDASTATNATVVYADGDGFLRVYSNPSQVLFLGSWAQNGRYRKRQSANGVSQIQSIDQANLTAADKAGNFSFGASGDIELNVDGVDNNFYKSGTTGQTQLYTADEGVDPGSEFDGVSVVPVIQNYLPVISVGGSSTTEPATATSQGSSSGTGLNTTSGQQTVTTATTNTTTSGETASGTGTASATATSNAENSSSTSADESNSASSTGFTSACPTDSANPTVFATITGDGYEAVTDIISVGGAFYTCWCSSFLNLFAGSRTVTVTSSILDLSTSISKTIVTEESTSVILSQTGVIPATTTSYIPWPSRTRRQRQQEETISTPDALTRFAESNITAGCNLMVSYPIQSTIEETILTTAPGLTVSIEATTTSKVTETTEFYASTEVSVVVATPSSFNAVLGWRRPSGSLTYLEGGTISNNAFELETANGPAGQLTLDTTGRLVYPRLDSNTGLMVDWYAAALVVSDATQPTAAPLMFAQEATVTSNGWEYVGFFSDRNTIIIDPSQSAGGYNKFGLCTYSGATTVEKLVVTIDDTKPDDATYCDFRSFLNFQ
ncbi:hypothetical protein TWF718_000166 [Orbilia javanica]|uniref:Uncharacterized protein n=1 Tax=Orbilia javanica TaxID=47235 RepID=A0AAN8RFN9_9PEZI